MFKKLEIGFGTQELKREENLNNLIPVWGEKLEDPSVVSSNGKVSVYFRDLEANLIKNIYKADAVFGCVAWLTNHDIITAISKKEASIVVQKEDFLRPESNKFGWKEKLRMSYERLNCDLYRDSFDILTGLNYCGDPSMTPVRCVGNHNSEKKPAFPRMHNKFLVFCKIVEDYTNEIGNTFEVGAVPYAVWTGSFNFTANATNSFENALYITDKKIVEAYFKEFQQIYSISEVLDWESPWASSDLRVGS